MRQTRFMLTARSVAYSDLEGSFRAPPGAMHQLEGRAFDVAMLELLGEGVAEQCLLVAHQHPCLHGEVKGSKPFDGCEVCGSVVLLAADSLELVEEDPEVRLVCVECAWAATRSVEGRWYGVIV